MDKNDESNDAEIYRIDYKVPHSLDQFFYSRKFISLVVGPVGSTKTTAGLMKILRHASMMAPDRKGIRKSHAVWVRNTKEQLHDTSIPEFIKWIPDGIMGTWHKTYNEFLIKTGDIECKVLFRALDEERDARRLLSLQTSFLIYDEFREINSRVFLDSHARPGRYPSQKDNGVGCVTDTGESNAHVWGMSNPPDMGSFWEGYINNPPENVDITLQPSGLSLEADWKQYLREGYYEEISKGKPQNWVDIYVHAKFGRSLSGQPVFPCFNLDNHVSETELVPNSRENNQLTIAVDAGRRPAVVIGNMDYKGKLIIYASLHAEGLDAQRFIRERLKPFLQNRFPEFYPIIVIDPSAFYASDTDGRAVTDIYLSEGFKVEPARTNKITPRINSVEYFLTRTLGEEHCVMIDPVNAASLVTALAGKYRYKINRRGDIDDKPEKSHPWSDLADCFQYICMYYEGGKMFNYNDGSELARPIKKISSLGWT